tara:strand:- start:32 stop:220 length:189 start_codon:yes stop_codon:yes gene_type:complete
MIFNKSEKLNNFLLDELGLSEQSIKLALNLAKKNKTSLPITLWRYGLISLEELDRLYFFLFK